MRLTSTAKSFENLKEWGLTIDKPDGSLGTYIAHQDRLRLLYPILGGLFSIFFGLKGFVLLNILLLALLYRELYKYSNRNFRIFFCAAILASITPLPQQIWKSTPDLLICFLFSVLIRTILRLWPPTTWTKKSHYLPGLIYTVLLVVFLNLTKPFFVVLGGVILVFCFALRRRAFLTWGIFIVNFLFVLIWIEMSRYNFSSLQIMSANNPYKMITSWNFSQSNELLASPFETIFTPALTSVQRVPITTASELNYAISQNISFMLVIAIAPFLILAYRRKRFRISLLAATGLGAIVSQGWSGGLGLNYRFLMPYIFVSIGFLALEAVEEIDKYSFLNVHKLS